MKSRLITIIVVAGVGLGLGFWVSNRLIVSSEISNVAKLAITNKLDPAKISPSPTPIPRCATLVFGGDMMFDRNIRLKANEKNNYDFIMADLQPIFTQADVIIANLEGPVTDNPSRSVGSVPGSTDNYFFTFSPEILPVLTKWPFIVNLGNNHILNFGQSGLTQTYQYLDQANLTHFGYVQANQPQPSYLIKNIGGMKFGLVNYNQFVEGGRERVLADMAEIRPEVDVLVVYTHWGNEYVQENQVIKELAYQLVDVGADLIIGSHPHVVQGQEDYQGTRIYYSLGNMVFDQYFEEAVQSGLLVTAKVCQQQNNTQLEAVIDQDQIISTDLEKSSASSSSNPEIVNQSNPRLNWSFTDHPIQMLKTGETVL